MDGLLFGLSRSNLNNLRIRADRVIHQTAQISRINEEQGCVFGLNKECIGGILNLEFRFKSFYLNSETSYSADIDILYFLLISQN